MLTIILAFLIGMMLERRLEITIRTEKYLIHLYQRFLKKESKNDN